MLLLFSVSSPFTPCKYGSVQVRTVDMVQTFGKQINHMMLLIVGE